MPRVQAFFGVSYGTVRLTLSLYLVGVGVAQLFMGSLSDRYGLALPNAMGGAVSAHHHLSGTASGRAGFLQMAIGAIATLIVGHLQAETPFPMTVTMLCSATAACLALLASWHRRMR